MARANSCSFIGNLTRDPELRWVNAQGEQKAVCNFGLAVQRRGKDAPADFLEFTVWGAQAEALAQYKQKGNPLYVEGEARYRTWETEEGNKRSKVDFEAYGIQYLGQGPPKGSESRPAQQETVAANEEDFEDIPF